MSKKKRSKNVICGFIVVIAFLVGLIAYGVSVDTPMGITLRQVIGLPGLADSLYVWTDTNVIEPGDNMNFFAHIVLKGYRKGSEDQESYGYGIIYIDDIQVGTMGGKVTSGSSEPHIIHQQIEGGFTLDLEPGEHNYTLAYIQGNFYNDDTFGPYTCCPLRTHLTCPDGTEKSYINNIDKSKWEIMVVTDCIEEGVDLKQAFIDGGFEVKEITHNFYVVPEMNETNGTTPTPPPPEDDLRDNPLFLSILGGLIVIIGVGLYFILRKVS